MNPFLAARADLSSLVPPHAETENALIKSTHLGYEDHGIFTMSLTLDYGCGGQGFGGMALDEPFRPRTDESCRIAHRYAGQMVMALLDLFGKTEWQDGWERLPGMHCRAIHTHTEVIALGHFQRDLWVAPKLVWARLAALALEVSR